MVIDSKSIGAISSPHSYTIPNDELWGQAIEGTLSDGRNLKAHVEYHVSRRPLGGQYARTRSKTM